MNYEIIDFGADWNESRIKELRNTILRGIKNHIREEIIIKKGAIILEKRGDDIHVYKMRYLGIEKYGERYIRIAAYREAISAFMFPSSAEYDEIRENKRIVYKLAHCLYLNIEDGKHVYITANYEKRGVIDVDELEKKRDEYIIAINNIS
jgi:hypothetical protein